MTTKIVDVLKVLVITYIVTGILLLVLAFGLYRMQLSKTYITIGIIIVYAVSAAVGGYIMGKRKQHQRLIWGLLVGIVYFVILSCLSFVINRELSVDGPAMLRALLACGIGGAAGGIIS